MQPREIRPGSQESPYQTLIDGMRAEFGLLHEFLKSTSLTKFLKNYPKLTRFADNIPDSVSLERIRERFTIIYCSYILGGAADFFADKTFSFGQEINIDTSLARYIGSLPFLNLNQQVRRLKAVDTLHCASLLRAMGYLQRPSQQLSLGAGQADREVLGMYIIPSITTIGNREFQMKQALPENDIAIVLVDIDPVLSDKNNRFNNSLPANIRVKGVAADARDPSTLVLSPGFRPSLITALRFDPAMIPDAKKFLQGLIGIKGASAEFVASIGSGNTKSEWQARKEKLNELREALKQMGYRPKIITFTEQHEEPMHFAGIPENIANLQMLACSLER